MRHRRCCRAFTVVEILAVLAIVAVLSAILLPIVALARRSAAKSTCVENVRQLGHGMMLYLGSNDDRFPGTATTNPGGEWGDLIRPSVGAKASFHCPADSTSLPGEWPSGGIPQTVVSYGFNSNLSSVDMSWAPTGPVKDVRRDTDAHAALASPSRTALFFEVEEAVVDLKNVEGVRADGMRLGNDWPTGNTAAGFYPLGDDDAQDYPDGVGLNGLMEPPLYATGPVGGRRLNRGKGSKARHGGRAVYLACDGHAIALEPERVSGGADAKDASCDQGTVSGQTGACATQREVSAAGTGHTRYTLTFSTR